MDDLHALEQVVSKGAPPLDCLGALISIITMRRWEGLLKERSFFLAVPPLEASLDTRVRFDFGITPNLFT